MKVAAISIKNFKLFKDLEVSFRDMTLNEISDRFLLLGDNGSGKTSLLQAVALPLALATGKIRSIEEFDWTGFLPSRYFQWGNPLIEIQVTFGDAELEATQEVAGLWWDSRPDSFKRDHPFKEPGSRNEVTLRLDGDYWRVDGSHSEANQFRGRFYAQQLIKQNPSARSWFSKLPGVFWFDQYRNLGGNTPETSDSAPHEKRTNLSYEMGVGNLRNFLVNWRLRQKAGRPSDYLDKLEDLYKHLFPTRSFAGVDFVAKEDIPTEEQSLFLLSDGQRSYDLVEMSAGEQAIFPILYEFVRQQIANSVVLIDELDLNLHPPLAQSFAIYLPRMAPDCQFLITSHSEAVNDIISEDETYRLSGGALCL